MDSYKYCPRCAGKLSPNGSKSECGECGFKIYKNSIACVGILPIKGDRVLLAKRNSSHFKGKLDIIGGFLENGETPDEGIIREAKEETNLTIKPIRLLGIYTDIYTKTNTPVLVIHYLGRVIKGRIKPSDDVASLQWFPIEKIPDTLPFKNSREALKDLQKWYVKYAKAKKNKTHS